MSICFDKPKNCGSELENAKYKMQNEQLNPKLIVLCFEKFKGGATLQLSWTSKTNTWALTLFFK